MSRDEIIQQVKIKLDETGEFEESWDTISITADNLLNEATSDLLMLLPYHLLPLTEMVTTSLTQLDDGVTGYVPLNSDNPNYLRLGQFKMSEWERPVFYAYPDGTWIAQKQSNEYVRGGPAKPVCVLSNSTKNKRLYYYSVPGGSHTVDTANYVQRHKAEELDSELFQPLTWQCVANVAQVMNIQNALQFATTQVQNWIKHHSL